MGRSNIGKVGTNINMGRTYTVTDSLFKSKIIIVFLDTHFWRLEVAKIYIQLNRKDIRLATFSVIG